MHASPQKRREATAVFLKAGLNEVYSVSSRVSPQPEYAWSKQVQFTKPKNFASFLSSSTMYITTAAKKLAPELMVKAHLNPTRAQFRGLFLASCGG